jgi:hypothetical protein
MRTLVPTNHDSFCRDISSTAVLNTNVDALSAYKKQRERLIKTDKIFEDVEELKQQMSDIHSMLSQLLNRN